MGVVRFEPSYFRFDPESHPNRNGFDPDGPWQMVPYRGSRYLHVNAVGVTSWTVESVNPALASVARVKLSPGMDPRQGNVIEVKGRHPGRTFLIVRGPKREELGRIEVAVKLRRKLFIRFFLVSDSAGHRTTFSETDTKNWTRFLNESVFEPQVNVGFEYLSTGRLIINEDLGDVIDFSGLGDMPMPDRRSTSGRIWHEITDAGMFEPQVFNVFCVWDFLYTAPGNDGFAGFVQSKVRVTADEMERSGANYNMCMLKENVPGRSFYEHVLAHEAGHYLNRLPFHTDGPDLLMTPGEGGTRLRKADAARMNPDGG